MPLTSKLKLAIAAVVAVTLLAVGFGTYWFGRGTTDSSEAGGNPVSDAATAKPELRDIWGTGRRSTM